MKKEKEEEKFETWECEYLEWGGTRTHPKAIKVTEIGRIKGNWFHLENGKKKNIYAKGFCKLRKIEEK